jgi:type VI secretion system protein ImpB
LLIARFTWLEIGAIFTGHGLRPDRTGFRCPVETGRPLLGVLMAESLQHKLDRVRSPRVHITYDVETGGAIEKKELPFVMGVFGDFTGMPEEPLPRLKDRKFVEVNPDNFDSVLAAMKPHLAFSVENKLSEDADAGQLKVDLRFRSLDDFAPANVAKQIRPLQELLDLRTKLADLRGSLQGNDKLDEILQETIRNTDKLAKLKSEIQPTTAGDGSHE